MKVVKSRAPIRAFAPFELTLFFENKADEKTFREILSLMLYKSPPILEHIELAQTIKDALDTP